MANRRNQAQAEKKTVSKPIQNYMHADRKRLSASLKIFLLFFISFLMHSLFNILVNESPKVVIDEGLYTNIARSLAWRGELAFRGQPVNYPYLLYPFLLVPLYWLNRSVGGDIYRIIQVFNTLLITSSVFPAYCFARDFTRDVKKSFTSAFIVAIMPDMLMGGYEMTESLLWPLSLWMVFFCYRFFSSGKLQYGLFTALLTGLMFATKPGAVAAGAVMLLAHCILSVKTDKKKIKASLLSCATLLLIVGMVYGIFLLFFGQQESLLGLYTKQTEEWKAADILVALEAFFLLLFLFVFACGGLYGIFPLTHFSDYEGNKRPFILSFLFGIVAVIIGTSVFVVPYKWIGKLGYLPLHLRYCSMFVPFMYIFSVDLEPNPKYAKRLIIGLSVFIAMSLFPGARAGFVDGKTGMIDSITIAAFQNTLTLNGDITGCILTILVILCTAFFIYQLSG